MSTTQDDSAIERVNAALSNAKLYYEYLTILRTSDLDALLSDLTSKDEEIARLRFERDEMSKELVARTEKHAEEIGDARADIAWKNVRIRELLIAYGKIDRTHMTTARINVSEEIKP